MGLSCLGRALAGLGFRPRGLRSGEEGLGSTWTPKVCKRMAFMAVIMGLGLLFNLLFGFRLRV